MGAMSMLMVLAGGALFGFGLALSTMIRPEVVLSFLRFEDFGLMLVMGGAVAVTALVYFVAPRVLRKPPFGPAFGRHASAFDTKTIVGSAIFGVGWGISGVCPGPAIAGLGSGNWPLLWALVGMFAGAWLHGLVESRK